MNRYLRTFFLLLLSASTFVFGQKPCPGTPTITYDGKIYNTVQIGKQCWLRENLDIGTMIPMTKSETNNGVIEKYCYDNDSKNCDKYGGLYQWAEALQYANGATNDSSSHPALVGEIQGICPKGWHIPSFDEFRNLAGQFNYDANALKAVNQGVKNGIGTNASGFTALLTGFSQTEVHYNSNSNMLGDIALFWSSTERKRNSAAVFHLYDSNNNINLNENKKSNGLSVRCIKN